MALPKALRVGFLGAGGIADRHVQSLLKLPNVHVVAICNHRVQRASELKDKHRLEAECFGDFDQMVQHAKLDALYVCLPPGAHRGEVERAAGRGLHLFLEKPISLSIEQSRSMAAAVQAAGVVCQVGHHLRFAEPVRRLKAMIDDGMAGRPLLAQGRWFCNALHPAWWQDPNMGGGQLIEQAIHVYDLARHFFGDAASAAGFADRLSHDRFADYQVDDNSAAVIRFANGGIASLCASNSAIPGQWKTTMTVVCEKLTAELQLPDQGRFVVHGGLPAEELTPQRSEVVTEEIGNPTDCYEEITRNFIAAVRGEELPRCTIDDGVKGLELVMAIARSSNARGAVQRLDD